MEILALCCSVDHDHKLGTVQETMIHFSLYGYKYWFQVDIKVLEILDSHKDS